MKHQENLEKEAEARAARREKKRKGKMKVSGRGVLKIQEFIRKRGGN